LRQSTHTAPAKNPLDEINVVQDEDDEETFDAEVQHSSAEKLALHHLYDPAFFLNQGVQDVLSEIAKNLGPSVAVVKVENAIRIRLLLASRLFSSSGPAVRYLEYKMGKERKVGPKSEFFL
jgi:hypothetical protein